MATVADQDEQNPQNPSNAQPLTGGSGGAGGSGQGGSAKAAAPVSNVQQNSTPQQNQGYTDVGSYLDANQSGSQQLGNQVASNLTNQYNTTKSGIDNSANSLINQVNQGYTKGNDQLIQSVASDPTKAASDPNQVAQFQSQLNDTYTGPQNWADYGTQQGNVANAQSNANLVNTPGGLNVLTSQVEQPGASQGVNQLDTLLLGGNSNAVQNVHNAATPFNDLGTYLDSQNQTANTAIGNAGTAAQMASQNALNAFTGANGTLTNLNNTINQNTTQAQQKAQTIDQEAKALLANPQGATINPNDVPDVLKALNMTPEQLGQLQSQANKAEYGHFVASPFQGNGSAFTQGQNLDFSGNVNFANPNTAITAGNVATPEQYSEMAAIQQLLGGKTPQGAAINPALASLAGTTPTSTFDPNGAIAAGQQANDAAQQQALTQANSMADQQQAAHQASLPGSLLSRIQQPSKDVWNKLNKVGK